MKPMKVVCFATSEETKWIRVHLSSNCEIDKEQRVSEPEDNCKECDYIFDKNNDLRTHEEEYHEGLESFVQIVVQPSSGAMDEDRLVSEPESKTCQKCGDDFNTRAELVDHLETYH